MRFKDLKLGRKLAIGFGVLILISVILGGLAIYNMMAISEKSEYLANEYVPEVEIANNIERNSLLTMYAMRAYSYSEEDSYLRDGMARLTKVKKYLDDANDLSKESTQLKKLEEAVGVTNEAVTKYEQLANQTVEINKNLKELRDNMHDAAELYMKNCNNFLEEQNINLIKDINQAVVGTQLKERHEKITLINDVIDKGNELRVANYEAQATRNPVLYKNAINGFKIDEELRQLRKVTRQAANIALLASIESAGANYKNAMNEFIEQWTKREELNKERGIAADEVLKNSQDVAQKGIENTELIANEAVSLLGSSSMVMVFGLIIALIIGIILAMVLTRIITEPIHKGVAFAKEMANGNLNAIVEVDQKDEIGDLARALTGMGDRLRDIVTGIIESAQNIASASEEMAATSQEMSQGANEQAASAEEVSSSIEEMTANIQQNTDNAQQTEKISLQAVGDIEEGNKAVSHTVEAMRSIAEKIMIINEIANKTDLLAINAAIEAARAGEHGKGFAVVATEVRKLAERSQVAANEIDELSNSSMKIAERSGNLLNDIVPSIKNTSKLVQEISAASIEQSSGANQINTAIQQLNKVTQQSASASEEMATGSEELSSQAEQLKDVIGFFKVDTHNIRKRDKKKLSIKHAHNKSVSKKSDDAGIDIDMDDNDLMDSDYEKF